MVIKYKMIRDAITMNINSPTPRTGNSEGAIMIYPRRLGRLKWISPIIVIFFLAVIATNVHAMTTQEILEQVNKHSFSDNFRVPLTIKAFKGDKLVSSHSLWLIVRVQDGKVGHFLDFQEPKESNGLRLLFLEQPGQEPGTYIYFPSTGQTKALAVDDPPVDVGGTGLTTEDFQIFFSKAQPENSVPREEPVGDRECYVIKVSIPQSEGERLLWVSKNGFLVVKDQQLDGQGNILRSFVVNKFFKTLLGKEYPREEEITIPGKGIRVAVRQEVGVFGIEIPEEITDPAKFGAFQWKR